MFDILAEHMQVVQRWSFGGSTWTHCGSPRCGHQHAQRVTRRPTPASAGPRTRPRPRRRARADAACWTGGAWPSSRAGSPSWPRRWCPSTVVGTVIAMPLAAGEPVGVALLLVDPEVNVGHDHPRHPRAGRVAAGRGVRERPAPARAGARMRAEALEADREALLLAPSSRQDMLARWSSASWAACPTSCSAWSRWRKSPTRPCWCSARRGSGEEVIARAIHSRSQQSKGPIVRVDCSTIQSELVDSELFGHERGSFAGHSSHAQGLVPSAPDGGRCSSTREIGEFRWPPRYACCACCRRAHSSASVTRGPSRGRAHRRRHAPAPRDHGR